MSAPSEYHEIVLQPGEFYFGDAVTRIRTLLGSCVAITMWHPVRRVGGMCHYLLPTRQGAMSKDLDGRYGDEALLMFLKAIDDRKTKPRDYQVKVFGGGNMFPTVGKGKAMEVGARNISLAVDLLGQMGCSVVARHVGDIGHRAIIFDVWSGDVWVKHQRRTGPVELGAAR